MSDYACSSLGISPYQEQCLQTQSTVNAVIRRCQCVIMHAHPWVFHLIKSNAGRDRRHLCVRAEEALWTFDTTALTWQQRHPSGPLPEPVDARGLAVVNDHAYLLASQLFAGGRLEVYELDLATWVWRLLPGQGSVLPCLRWFTPVVIQVQNLF